MHYDAVGNVKVSIGVINKYREYNIYVIEAEKKLHFLGKRIK